MTPRDRAPRTEAGRALVAILDVSAWFYDEDPPLREMVCRVEDEALQRVDDMNAALAARAVPEAAGPGLPRETVEGPIYTYFVAYFRDCGFDAATAAVHGRHLRDFMLSGINVDAARAAPPSGTGEPQAGIVMRGHVAGRCWCSEEHDDEDSDGTIARTPAPTAPATGDPEYMCPNCVTPWKCNGPHIPEDVGRVADTAGPGPEPGLRVDVLARALEAESKSGRWAVEEVQPMRWSSETLAALIAAEYRRLLADGSGGSAPVGEGAGPEGQGEP